MAPVLTCRQCACAVFPSFCESGELPGTFLSISKIIAQLGAKPKYCPDKPPYSKRFVVRAGLILEHEKDIR